MSEVVAATAAAAPVRAWIAIRRPLLMATVLGSVASLCAAGLATPRLAIPSAIYWAHVPIWQIVALRLVTLGHARGRFPLVVDTFFAGTERFLLFLLAIGLAVSTLRPDVAWTLLLRAAVPLLLIGLAWSVYVDTRFFRQFLGLTRSAAIARVVLFRAITWPIIFGLFAVPGLFGVFHEISAAIRDLLSS